MDHDNLNDMIDEWLGDGDGPPPPTWRATIRGRRLMLTHWAPWLAQGGPQTKLLTEREEAGFTIADLTVHGEDDDEVSVRFYAVGAELERAEQVLVRVGRSGRLPADLAQRPAGDDRARPRAARRRVGPLPDLPGDAGRTPRPSSGSPSSAAGCSRSGVRSAAASFPSGRSATAVAAGEHGGAPAARAGRRQKRRPSHDLRRHEPNTDPPHPSQSTAREPARRAAAGRRARSRRRARRLPDLRPAARARNTGRSPRPSATASASASSRAAPRSTT